MSLHYLLDGYNIIKNVPALEQSGLEDNRSRLIRFIETARPQGSRRNKVTIVFDGRPGVWSAPSQCEVEVVFSQGESADDKIKCFADRSSQPKQIVVVTDDRSIRYHVRAKGCAVLSVKDFYSRMKLPELGTASGKQPSREGKAISKTLEQQITSEMKTIWLKDGDGQEKPG